MLQQSTIQRSPSSPTILGQKAKSNHQGDSSEQPVIFTLDLAVCYRLHPDGRAGSTHLTGMHSCFHCCFILLCFTGFTPTVDCHAPNFSCDNHTKCITPDKLCNNNFECDDETDEGFLCGTITQELYALFTQRHRQSLTLHQWWRKRKHREWVWMRSLCKRLRCY